MNKMLRTRSLLFLTEDLVQYIKYIKHIKHNIKHVKVRYKSEQSFQTSQCSLSNHNR